MVKLLLVEDDKKIATMVKRGLEAEGFTVDVAFDGLDGRWLAIEGSYDLMILDIMLTRRNGYQVCADLREEGNWMPILMLTAKNLLHNAQRHAASKVWVSLSRRWPCHRFRDRRRGELLRDRSDPRQRQPDRRPARRVLQRGWHRLNLPAPVHRRPCFLVVSGGGRSVSRRSCHSRGTGSSD